MFLYFREVRRLWPLNDTQNPTDFVLLTSFPQRRINELESSLETAGEVAQCSEMNE